MLSRLYSRRFGSSLAYRNTVWQTLNRSFFTRWIAADADVLDVGCGYGEFINNVTARSRFAIDLNPENFRREISRARTFGCMSDVARLWSAGFALGASFENSVVFDETRLLNTEGLRYSDECARHKVLDVIGDLALAGLPLLGAFRSVRGGHKLNHAVLTAMLADRSAWRVVEAEPARRSRGHAEAGAGMVGGMVAPAYGPDVS